MYDYDQRFGGFGFGVPFGFGFGVPFGFGYPFWGYGFRPYWRPHRRWW
ncbi:MAG: hypothetical protein ACI35O_00760 [Bacillaceae bacterium]